jgi:tetratricopeptide (TPR) repeat protein
MRKQTTSILSLLAACLLGFVQSAIAQQAQQGQQGQQGQGQAQGQGQQNGAPAETIDAQTGKILNEAIELLNMENYSGARDKITTLRMDRLSPYERGKVEQILFSIEVANENYEAARRHLQASIESGGLNEQEVQTARYQYAQLFMQEEKWREGAAALEEWFMTATNPNSAAYYLLAVAYYQMDDYNKAMEPAKKAVDLMERPQPSWVELLLALHLQRDQYREAIPLLERLIAMQPDKKTYWQQLSSIYGQLEDYPNALAIAQLAYSAGLVTDDSEIRRLADLLLYNDVPYRGATILEAAIEKRQVNVDDKLYEKLANCWIAAGEFDRAIQPLQRAAELSPNGDLFVRLGEVQVQREDWAAAVPALQRGIEKGQLRDAGYAQLLMGIALFNQKQLREARDWFNRSRNSERHRKMSTDYLAIIDAQLG